MGRNGRVLLMLAAIAAAAPCGAAVISAEGRHGRVVTVRTGTDNGDCRNEGHEVVCTDGRSVAVADLSTGCTQAAGGGRCEVSARRLEDGGVTAQSGSTDIECESGAKKGYVYTVSDGDGQGSCSPSYDINGAVNGGVCTKNRVTCAVVNCQHGCDAVALNCECHIKTRPRVTATTSD